MYKKNNKGFTMVEILAVIVILGILAGVAIPSVSRYIKKSRKQAYETMENSLYDGARNYVLDENLFLNKCSNGYSDIEGSENLLTKFQYVENLIDPADKSKQCDYKVYGCMENEQSMDALATYKYKVQIKCIDYENCAIYRDDGTRLPCEDLIDDTRGPECGSYTSSNTSWSSADSVNIELACVPSASGKCAQPTYSQIFTSEGKSSSIEIKDVFGNKTVCSVDIYIDRTPPSKPVINNPYENVWTNKSYSIQISSSDDLSGIKYFEYRYPNSTNASEREWKQWSDSSKEPKDSSPFTTTKFSLERNEYVEVRACDYAGNCSDTTQSMIKIDKSSPMIPVLSNSYNGIWAGPSYVDADKYVIGVTSSDSASGIEYYQYRYPNSENVWHTYANSSGNSFTTTPFRTERNEIVDIRACDNVGNCSQPAQNTIMIDKTAPVVPTITNANNNKWVNTNYTITAKSKDSGSGLANIQYSVDNTNWTSVTNSSANGNVEKSVTLTISTEGSYSYYVRSCDNVGICSGASSTIIKLDKNVPTVQASEVSNYTANAKISIISSETGTYCVNTTSSRTNFSNCVATGNIYANTTLTTSALPSATYYVHVKDAALNIGVSNSVTLIQSNPFGEYLLKAEPKGLNVSQSFNGMYRFRGDDVNNYVKLGNVLYRVIGVTSENNSTIGLERYQVKLISADSIGEYGWMYGDGTNESWTNSNVYAYLQSSSVLGNTNIIPDGWSNKITAVKSYTGYAFDNDYYGSVDQYADDTTISNIASNEKRSVSSSSAKLSLLYVTDWCLANNLSMSQVCDISSYTYNWMDPTSCRQNDFNNHCTIPTSTKKQGVPDTNGGSDWINAIIINKYGSYIVGVGPGNKPRDVYPTLYLLSSVNYISGSGTYSDPFIIN